MKLGDKLRSLRAVEGSASAAWPFRMTQQELARHEEGEIGRGLARPISRRSRMAPAPSNAHNAPALLAQFPSGVSRFLVDDRS